MSFSYSFSASAHSSNLDRTSTASIDEKLNFIHSVNLELEA
jgi:hypothetical protein